MGINFQKMRLITEIISSLKIEFSELTDYSFLELDPQLAQTIFNAAPLSEDELYERSKEISECIRQQTMSTDIPLLHQEIAQLREELDRIKQESAKKDQLIEKQKKIIEEKDKIISNLETAAAENSSANSSW